MRAVFYKMSKSRVECGAYILSVFYFYTLDNFPDCNMRVYRDIFSDTLFDKTNKFLHCEVFVGVAFDGVAFDGDDDMFFESFFDTLFYKQRKILGYDFFDGSFIIFERASSHAQKVIQQSSSSPTGSLFRARTRGTPNVPLKRRIVSYTRPKGISFRVRTRGTPNVLPRRPIVSYPCPKGISFRARTRGTPNVLPRRPIV